MCVSCLCAFTPRPVVSVPIVIVDVPDYVVSRDAPFPAYANGGRDFDGWPGFRRAEEAGRAGVVAPGFFLGLRRGRQRLAPLIRPRRSDCAWLVPRATTFGEVRVV